jgi:hypothetical protein
VLASFDLGSLLVTVNSYEGGDPKIQISRKFENREGEMKFGRAGRLTMDEFSDLVAHAEDIRAVGKGGKKTTTTKTKKKKASGDE